MARIAVSFSRGIRSIRHIEKFLDVDALVSPNESWDELDDVCVVVWGRKEKSLKAISYANDHDLRVLYLEDGFIRTCSPDSHSRNLYSIIVDRKGVYYDATVSSEFEQLLNSRDADFELAILETGEELIQACLETIVENNITKYNYCADYVLDNPTASLKRVLVVDQTVGDCSVIYGGMDETGFIAMLEAAIDENPEADVYVKTHPDVIAGDKQGYLTSEATNRGIVLLSDPVNPLSLLKTFDHVYVGTSQLGFEALLCGKPVSVFGRPFYAGWGLTDDRVALPGRGVQRSLRELFYVAYMHNTRYVNPVTAELWTLPECLEHVLLQKRVFQKNAYQFLCVGFTPWKRRYITQYLRSPAGSVVFGGMNHINQDLKKNKCDVIATWGYRERALQNAADNSPATPIMRIEDGFLRSTGLGSDFIAPSSLVLDWTGLYFNAQQASDLESLINAHESDLNSALRATRLINLILSANLTKYNVGDDRIDFERAVDQRALLVVGQVENDASLRFGCDDVCSNTDLLQHVRSHNPDAWIIYKPHPDVVAGNRRGSVRQSVLDETVDCVTSSTAIVSCIEHTDELHTMTSLSGFEALLRRKKVVTYGKPFYAGWGLTTDIQTFGSRRKQITLEELVYCTLIAYPRYMDIDTGEFTTPENIIFRIKNNQMNTNNKPNWSSRQMRKLINVYKGLSYAP